MKVVLTYDMGKEFEDDLRASFPDVDFRIAYAVEDQVREVPGAEVVFGEMGREAFLAATDMKWFHFVGIGFDGLLRDNPEHVDSNLILTNARETHVIPISEHVFAVMLALAHRVPQLVEDRKARRWDLESHVGRVRELAGTTVGCVAMGDIGRGVALRAQAFEMEVYAVDILEMDPPAGVREVWGVDRLDDLMAISDWLIIAAPLTERSRGMVDRGRVEKLKPGGHVIVVSRGGILDEEALAEGLRSGRIAGAGVDCAAVEPLPPQSPLWDAPNVILSPHSCAESPQLVERRGQIFIENLRRYLAGEELQFVCDKHRGY